MKRETVFLLAIYADVATLKSILCQFKKLATNPPDDWQHRAQHHAKRMEQCLHRMETNLLQLDVNDE